MCDITTKMISLESKKFNNDLNIENYNEEFTQNIIPDLAVNSNSLLYKIYLEITNKKTVYLKETLDENHKVIENVAKSYSLKKCNIGEIIEIPIDISSLFDDTKSYYRYGVSFNDSFLASILIIFDKLYMTLSNNIQNNYIKNLKKKLAYDLEEKNYYKKFNFKPNVIKKTDFQKILLENSNINSHIEKYISYYFNINILIIDLIHSTSYFICDFNSNIITVILFKINQYYEPLLNENDNNIFDDDNIISKITKIFCNKSLNMNKSNEQDNDVEIRNNTEIVNNLEKDTDMNFELKHIRHYKLAELQDLCKSNNLDILDGNKKKKKKNILYDELLIIYKNQKK